MFPQKQKPRGYKSSCSSECIYIPKKTLSEEIQKLTIDKSDKKDTSNKQNTNVSK